MAKTADFETRLAAVEREIGILDETVATVVAELRTRKVLPEVPIKKDRRRRVVLSPEARKKRRADLLAEARKSRWPKKGRKR